MFVWKVVNLRAEVLLQKAESETRYAILSGRTKHMRVCLELSGVGKQFYFRGLTRAPFGSAQY